MDSATTQGIEPILHSKGSNAYTPSTIETGDLRVNLDTKTVEVNGKHVHLTRKEYQMLALLSLRKGETVTKEMFLNHLYSCMEDEPELKIIDVFICKLRKKLQAARDGQHYIETVWGRGYMLRDLGCPRKTAGLWRVRRRLKGRAPLTPQSGLNTASSHLRSE